MIRWKDSLKVDALVVSRGELNWHYTFAVPSATLLVLMGPSGSGKSSLLECIGGFLPAKAGSIRFGAESLQMLPPEKRPVSSLFQQHNLFEHLSIEHNLRLGFHRGKPSFSQWQKVLEACERLGVADLLLRSPNALSGGQRQRVALIRTVLREQPILLLDEPFSALDDDTRTIAGDWMREHLNQTGQCALLVSHQQEDSQRWADQILTI